MNLSVMLRQSAAKQAGLPMLSQGCSLGFHGNSIFRAWCNPQKILGHLFVIFLGHGTFTDTHLNGYNFRVIAKKSLVIFGESEIR